MTSTFIQKGKLNIKVKNNITRIVKSNIFNSKIADIMQFKRIQVKVVYSN